MSILFHPPNQNDSIMRTYAKQYKSELIENIIPFWTKHSPDYQCGGFFTCLDRRGNVFDSDKFTWLQSRAVWMFATLYKDLEPNPLWRELAIHGASFLEKYGRDPKGDFYFSVDRVGSPLSQPYSIFSDCYAVMAFAALFKITGDSVNKNTATKTFQNILSRRDNPKGKYSKAVPGTRDLKSFSIAMIMANLALEMESFLDAGLVGSMTESLTSEIMENFVDHERLLVYENVRLDGSKSDSFDGRLMNPGHGLEAMWVLMDLGHRSNDHALIVKAGNVALSVLEFGWDEIHEGIFYLRDSKGSPTQQLEWDQKLWWVHVEALVCMAKLFHYTGNPSAAQWFTKLHDYTWAHFKDPEFGEWFGYLNRRGEVLLDLKGGKWKGFFHIPRALLEISRTLQ